MNAELLPDNTNIVNEDGDVVPVESEPTVDFPSPENDEPAEVYRSPKFYEIDERIQNGIETSRADGYASLKVKVGERSKPLAQFLAIDLFKKENGLSMDETRELLKKYGADPEAKHPTVGGAAVAEVFSIPDVRMLAAGDDTYK